MEAENRHAFHYILTFYILAQPVSNQGESALDIPPKYAKSPRLPCRGLFLVCYIYHTDITGSGDMQDRLDLTD